MKYHADYVGVERQALGHRCFMTLPWVSAVAWVLAPNLVDGVSIVWSARIRSDVSESPGDANNDTAIDRGG